MSDQNNENKKKGIIDQIYDIPLDEYVEYVNQIPDVTDAEVLEYYKQMIEAQKAQTMLKEDSLDDQSRKLLEQSVEKGNQAKQNLIESKLSMVADMAKKFVGQGTSVQNLIQEGNQGVAHAVENLVKNNPEKFNGMIPSWIRQRMEHAVQSDEDTSKEEK